VRAGQDEVSLNDLVSTALECYLYGRSETHNLTIHVENLSSSSSASGTTTNWLPISARIPAHVQH
jgi:hypothetical protein